MGKVMSQSDLQNMTESNNFRRDLSDKRQHSLILCIAWNIALYIWDTSRECLHKWYNNHDKASSYQLLHLNNNHRDIHQLQRKFIRLK